MAKDFPLPTGSEAERLVDALIGADEEMDAEIASEVLADYGIDPEALVADFQTRLAAEVAEMKERGASVPQMALDALADIESLFENREEVEAAAAWLDLFFEGGLPADAAAQDGARVLRSFRAGRGKTFSLKDRETLDELAAEIDAEEF